MSMMTTLTNFLDIIYENEVPKFTIHYENVNQYNILPNISQDLYDDFENEIFQLRSFLQGQIKSHITKSGSKILLFGNQEIKTNQFKLCEVIKPNHLNTSSLLVINYNVKLFNVFPNYSALLNSRRQMKNLSNHLFKLFLINLEDQIDTLIRMKYHDSKDMKNFMKHLKSTIKSTIKNKLIPSCISNINQRQPYSHIEAFIHEVYKQSLQENLLEGLFFI